MGNIQEKSVEDAEKGIQISHHCAAFCHMASISILVSQCCRCTRSSHMNMWIYWVIDLVIQHDAGL